MSSTRTFLILSKNVNTSNDVFNNLILVKDKETGEEGTLLCSHMCEWPSDLFPLATWLEGCKTPEEFKDEPRLALGYHPNHYTQWRVSQDKKEVQLYLTGSWNPTLLELEEVAPTQFQEEEDEEDEILYLHTGLPYVSKRFYSWDAHNNEHMHVQIDDVSPALLRLAQGIMSRYTPIQERLDELESSIHRLYNSGRIDGWTASVLAHKVLWDDNQTRIHWEGPKDLFLSEGTSAFADVKGMYSDDKEKIPLQRYDYISKWEVVRDIPGYYQKAVPLRILVDDQNRAVYCPGPLFDEDEVI